MLTSDSRHTRPAHVDFQPSSAAADVPRPNEGSGPGPGLFACLLGAIQYAVRAFRSDRVESDED